MTDTFAERLDVGHKRAREAWPRAPSQGSQNFLEWKPSARNEFTPVTLEAVKSMRIRLNAEHVANRYFAACGCRYHRH